MAASSLSVADVHNLMACVCNHDLAPAVRCSAVHQLNSLAPSAQYLPVLAVHSFLDAVLREVERTVGIVDTDHSRGEEAGVEGEDGVATAAPLSIFQMQLPVAGLVLLGTLCTCSRGVLVCCCTAALLDP
jgi:hypothetical protein